MHVALFARYRLPVRNYGGTQRVIMYLLRGLAAAGHRVTLIAGAGTCAPEAAVIPLSRAQAGAPDLDVRPLLPRRLDVLLSFGPLAREPEVPWIRSIHGNQKPGSMGAPNRLYVSRDHARRHGSAAFVYNGIDPSEFRFEPHKAGYDLFLGRLHRVKGYRWAIEGTRRTGHRLIIAGGWRPSLRPRVRYVGTVGGARKAELLAGARCLWMPALWDEPFGLTLIEAMASGTPVLGTRRGALPEIVSDQVGALGDSLDELVELRARIDRIGPTMCRARVERHFTHHHMAAEYVRMFEGFLTSGELPAGRTISEG